MRILFPIALLSFLLSCQTKTTVLQDQSTDTTLLPDSLNGPGYICLNTKKEREWKVDSAVLFQYEKDSFPKTEFTNSLSMASADNKTICLHWGVLQSGSISYLPFFQVNRDTLELNWYNLVSVKTEYTANGKLYEPEFIKEERFGWYRVIINRSLIPCKYARSGNALLRIN
ncbi:MAG: hypothetical protein JNL57_10625 [Bacteroidetes bacterium]|nr:hypothetical protein [Bacteroidota bacterium]